MIRRTTDRSALEQLQRDERAALLRRRRVAGYTNAQARQLPVVGLALSGGGVRSATYCLGLMRGLAAQGLFRRVDFLSSVSGGGFTAAMFGRLVCGLGLTEAQRVLAAGQSPVLDWLRRNGRYLTPAGSRDLGVAAVSFLRAFLAIHLETFFALVPLALLVTLPHMLQNTTRALESLAWQDWGSAWLPLALAWTALSAPGLLVAYWAAPEVGGARGDLQRRLHAGDVLLLAALIGVALLVSWHGAQQSLADRLRQAELLQPLLALALWSAVIGHAGAMLWLARADEARPLAVGRLRNRLTYGLRAALLGTLGLLAIGLLDMASWQVLLLLTSTEQTGWIWGGLGVGGAALVVLRALAAPLQQLATQALHDTSRAIGPMLLNVAGQLAVLVLVLAWLVTAQWWMFDQAPLALVRPFPAWMRWLVLALGSALWWLGTAHFAQSVNASSLYSFYQARLVRAYLAVGNPRRGLWAPFTPRDLRLRDVTEVAREDDIDLTAHRPECRGGPLHLVNTCLNQTRDDASGLFNADRKGTLVTASARALEVGPRDVLSWQDFCPQDGSASGCGTLGHWVAVSGAAAAPGAGSYTSRGWALVMFLLGIRLGYWTPAPTGPGSAPPGLTGWLWRHAPKPLMMWGEASATFHGRARPWWYLSDGGHFENTGVYALIKRQCDFIVLADASADGDYQFADIENLVRKARIDLDAEIEFYPHDEAARLLSLSGSALTVLSPDEMADNASARGVLLARIRYRAADPAQGEREGTLLVVKPALHAALDLDLLAYAQRRPKFPHESTGDQFFDEAQWESYHRLGEDVGHALYDRWLAQLPGWDRAQLHKLAAPARLHRTGGAAATDAADGRRPGWRRGAKAAAIGTSVGLGVLGTAALSIWQVQDQFRRADEDRRSAISRMMEDSSRELGALDAACPRLPVHTIGQIAQLRQVQGSPALTPLEDDTIDRLMTRVGAQCARLAGPVDAACATAQTLRQELCPLIDKMRSEVGALSYWHPPQTPPDGVRSLAQVWNLLRGTEPATVVAVAPQAPDEPLRKLPPISGAIVAAAPPVPPAPLPTTPEPTPGAAGGGAEQRTLRARIAAHCPGTTVFTQIYDESARARAQGLNQQIAALLPAGARVGAIENVSRTAKLRNQRRPVPWVQPTFIAHDEAARQCGQALADVVKTGWPREGDAKVWVGTLPAGLQGEARALELWLPTPAQDRRAAAVRDASFARSDDSSSMRW